MYAASFAMIIGCLLGFLIPAASARGGLSVSPATPANYDAIQVDLDNIPPYLEESQCGGWEDRSVEGTIATVQGVPGRNGVWNGNILSGMGMRKDENEDDDSDNDFIFPDTAKGLTTACSPNKTSIKKKVWRPGGIFPGEIVQVDITYPHPQFADPSCRWRPKDGDNFQERAPDIPLKPLDQYDPAPTYGELNEELKDRQSPENCNNFCTMLNSYQYEDCLETITIEIPATDITPAISYAICNRWSNKYLCSDQEATNANGACNINTGDKANSIQCKGAECRCQENGGPTLGNQCIENPGTKMEEAPVYYSYYRFFQGSYAREAVTPEDSDDVASNNADVACYGFYDEFDPKTRQTIGKDRRCVINISLVDRPDTQQEKGKYGQDSNFEDHDVSDPNNQRTPYGIRRTPGNFNKDEDLWYLKLGGGFSLLNEEVFSGSYSNNLTNVFLNNETLDTAKIRATEQLEKGETFASGSTIRAFDDTGERSVASWWQMQQSAVAELLHPPIVRMILPSGWAMGIDATDPFFQTVKKKILTPFDKRNDRIEVQINAADDTLGSTLAYLERSLLLQVIEEPIPAIVPVGSATEFRGRAEAWCGWYMQKNNKQDCKDAPQKVKDLIETLETYATDIKQYRLLRSELALYASKILTLQQSVTKPITDWVIGNIDSYTQLISQQKILQEQGGQAWRQVQQKMETFGSVTNMPWCMNQRFTMPIYSLLDEWLPARTHEGNRSANELPLIETEARADIVIDLSAVAFMSGTIVLPVLQPVQVRVTDFPSPPSPNEKEGEIPDYPDLPSIAAIQEALKNASDALPKPRPSSTIAVPLITFPTMSDEVIAQKMERIFEIGNTIDEMDERYKKFWKSMSPIKADEAGQADRNGIKQMKEKLECYAWDSGTCQHVEMDLRERLMRIGSRPLVFLNEDYQSKDEERLIGGPCVPEHDVCSPVHPEEGGERHLWEMIGPRTIKNSLEELRTSVRKATLPVPFGDIPENDFPQYGTSTSNLLPTFDVPRAIDLFPPTSSSSSLRP